jgi:transcriptional regulator with PAS, ATPase and Fis domain
MDIEQVLGVSSDFVVRQGMQSLLSLFNDSCEGMMAVDADSRIVWISEKYLHTLGLSREDEALGKAVEEVIPTSRMREVVRTGRPIMLDIMVIKNQTLVVMRIPLKDKYGQTSGAIGFALYDRLQHLKPLVSKFSELQRQLSNTQKELARLRNSKYLISSFIGNSPNVASLKEKATKAARSSSSVLLLGETGSGKEMIAHGIHAASERASAPFICVNISAIPETLLEAEFFGVAPGAFTGADRKMRDGKFKLADGGTLFLDEIGDMPVQVQAKLLRVLQEQEVEPLGSNTIVKIDVRVIAATSRDLKELVNEGKFRSDLYYRLNVLQINLPPLRERMEDLTELCDHLLMEIATRTGEARREINEAAYRHLKAYQWPGNVRELKNALEQACALSDNLELTPSDFSGIFPALMLSEEDSIDLGSNSQSLAQAVATLERKMILECLNASRGNKALTARMLGISRANLYQKLTDLGLMS